jgi:hypothetical protein
MSLKKRVPIPINMVIRSIMTITMNIMGIINQNNLEHNLSGEIIK